MSSTTGTGRLTRRNLLRATVGTAVGVAAVGAPLRGSGIPFVWANSAGNRLADGGSAMGQRRAAGDPRHEARPAHGGPRPRHRPHLHLRCLGSL